MSESNRTIYGSLTALDREDVTRVLWTRTGEWTHASEVEREIEHLRQQLLAIAKRYAAECRLCGGCGVRRRLDVDGVPLDDVACEQCADVRLVIARAEGAA
jgi:hypothetical protein